MFLKIIKSKQFWMNAMLFFVTLTLAGWLFSSGWWFIKGEVTFLAAIKGFEISPNHAIIAAVIGYLQVTKAEKGL